MTTPGDAVQPLSDAFKWTRDFINEPMLPLPHIHNPVKEGIDSGLDHLVKMALDSTGLMDMLEKVTGNLTALTTAAQEWQNQAKALRHLADELRRGGGALAVQWKGQAADAFGTHMGEAVAAVDATATDMDRTAHLISQAAEACRLAEETVIEIIREAIEALAVTLAGLVVLDIITVGMATIVDALVVDAEIELFIARVGKVSEELAETLSKLKKAVQALKRGGGSISKATEAAKELRQYVGFMNRFKLMREAAHNPSLETFGNVIAAKAANKIVKAPLHLLLGDGAPVAAAEHDLAKDPSVNAVTDELKHDLGVTQDPPPYRVPKSRIEEAFG
ncbi:hypothetical protein [Kitasatospora sp. NPDC101183]|uniref:WXG100-like domain-containing protein n=1 Tax=Kitasatospora sp. NPDC101183 TaxID=3364100 RepID=UPI0038062E45